MRLYEVSKYTPKPISKDEGVYDKVGKKTAAYILKYCQPWLKAAKGQIAFRGIQYDKSLAFTRPVRPNRRPKDSPEETHEFFNKLITLAGGVANRNNSAFITTSEYTANIYGTRYVVFPVGQFDYTYAMSYYDWYEEDDKIWEEFGSIMERQPTPKLLREIKKEIKVNKGLDQALRQSREIMVRCDKILYVEPGVYAFNVRDRL
jgi:hypothetical protein